ncbi:polysaccharide deacetylase family protein [Chelatococcus sambhunathii]|uniref:Chitooligosaccharide deacetylase n=1 Tax=Chelatococcus sambhunathii TaxID=363953 RepID=A0ABU1DBN2_9HYPH|nr:polysaccharide deacetylase family protein [Chelatococcus sambhunathii]MDR4305330.1 polysaccharide deacetylase family protein [Chelatococcus sambhunathii]
MGGWRNRTFQAVFDALDRTGANARLARRTRGLGVILTLHHVRPFSGESFAPNRLLEVEPDFLDATLTRARELGFDFVTLDEAVRRVKAGRSERPFLHLTFDDGYRDVRDFALPILERHGAPATLYIASAFADGEAELWWLSLEEAIRRADVLNLDLGPEERFVACQSTAEKYEAWGRIYWTLRAGPEERLRDEVRELALANGVDILGFARKLCMRWDELAEVARHPLIEIGAHTVTHPMLSKHSEAVARAEMADSRDAIARRLGTRPRHFAYPVGDPSAAGEREYELARELGFETAVTTRPGHLTAGHAQALHALPRVSLNGHFQNRAAVDALLSGAPFAMIDLAKRVLRRA